ncbi:MAG: hypothetical protein PHF11_04040 [Candidatus Omnitrophica bacterium]|nr:hypothetical protein [Candidatus Omnitrophota bacterium]
MKKLANLLVVLSILLVAYAVVSKLAGYPIVCLGPMKAWTMSVFVVAIFLMQVAILIKLPKDK